MKFAAVEEWLLLPFTPPVRRGSVLAGVVAALPTGGLPFLGFGPVMMMGRSVPLISPLAFALHLMLAIGYGAFLSLAIGRSRGWWTCAAAVAGTLFLYLGNGWLMKTWEFPQIASESRVVTAHVLFGCAFTIFFKLHQADAPGLYRSPLRKA